METIDEIGEGLRLQYRRPYRMGGYAFGFLLLCFLGVDIPTVGWAVLLGLAVGWPQLAHFICTREPGSRNLDRGCFLIDAGIASIYMYAAGFNPWVSLSLVFIYLMSGATAGGMALMGQQITVLVLSSVALGLGLGVEVLEETPMVVCGLSALSIIGYGCLIALLFRSNTKAAREAMKQVENTGRELSEALGTLATRNETLKQLDGQKTYFFQSISHELRTPLTLLLSPLEEELHLQPGNHRLETAWRNACRLLRLVNQLLDVQELAAGNREVKLKPVNLARFIHVCGDYFETATASKNIDFRMLADGVIVERDGHTGSAYFMLGEVDALEKIVFNFLSNALKHTPEQGTIELTVESRGTHVRLSVRDDGPGISEEAQTSLFTLFDDSPDADREKHGIGFGLVLARELATSLGGQVGVESSPGKGSTFWAEFPLLPTPKPVLDLLVVDDDEHICKMLDLVFKHSEAVSSVEFANSPGQARDIMTRYRVKCVLSDAHMPGESGPSLLNYVRESQPDCRRLLITGNADETILQDAVNLGGVHQVLYKPIDNHKLLAAVSEELKESPIVRQSLWNAIEMTPQDWHLATIPTASGMIDEDEVQDSDSVGEGALILVVDDLREMRALVADTLRTQGYRVLLAADGKQALSLATEHRPDMVITDWVMPVMSGVELIAAMGEHASLRDVSTVLLTANTDEEPKLIGQDNLGADAYLGKPFSVHELNSVVRTILELKVRERKLAALSNFLTESSLKEYVPSSVMDELLKARAEIRP